MAPIESEPGSPLQITGNITFTDRITGNSFSSSSDYELKAQNVSGKGIIFLLVHFTEMGPREGGVDHFIRRDNFFRNEEITPATAFSLDRSSGGRLIGSFNVRLLYAEFSDGSVYGERREAKDVLAARSSFIRALQRLDRANDDRSFTQALAQKLEPEEADNFLEGVVFAQRNGGTGAARRLVHTELANAEKHLEIMRSAAPLQKPVLKRYEMSGLVIALRPVSKKISVYNEDIPGFLTPRNMDYEVRDQTALSHIKVGDTIHATLLSANEEVWVLENPVVTGHP